MDEAEVFGKFHLFTQSQRSVPAQDHWPLEEDVPKGGTINLHHSQALLGSDAGQNFESLVGSATTSDTVTSQFWILIHSHNIAQPSH